MKIMKINGHPLNLEREFMDTHFLRYRIYWRNSFKSS